MKKYGIFTKPQHVEKLVNYLNQYTDIDYVISTNKYELVSLNFDIGISYCFPYIIDLNDEYNKNRIWYNYHPAPLPRYGDLGNYQKGIKEKVEWWGVSLHLMVKKVDAGPVFQIDYFKLKEVPINTQELGDISHYYLFQLFKGTINLLKGCPKNKKEFDEIKKGTSR